MSMTLPAPMAPNEQGDRAEAEEQAVQRGFGVGLGDQRVRGLGDGDFVGVFGVGGGACGCSTCSYP